jgi:DNA-binding SARP family transcriptional activator/tetratricopeptide (TPR) repeat protein
MSLEIRLLGQLEVSRNGNPLPLPPSKKTRALLAYLVATHRAHSRAHLCELLWEGPDDPRAALRWSLTKLRQLLDDDDTIRLVADHEQASFDARGASVDLADLRAEVSAGPAHASIEILKRAADRFRGEFLDGLDLADCYRYHEWWTAERESIRALRVGILSALTDRLQPDPEAALTYARARLLVDPFSEAAHISVIQLLGATGRARAALEQYESCRRMLAGQLGAKPSAALERARASLASSWPAAAEAMPQAVMPAPLAASSPLVGRAAERDVIAKAVARAVTGDSRNVLWVTGEPGIGKTRVLEEAASQVRALGGRVLSSRGYEAEMVRPYGPWIDALRPTTFSLRDASLRADLAPLLPELGTDTAGGDRNRLFDAVVRLVNRLANDGRPVALILDDVQWFDEASVGLLHFVTRALAGSHAMMACGARTAELNDNTALAGFVRALRREGRLHDLPLERLDAAAIRDLVMTIDPRVDVEGVVADSEGNALFAIEIARARARGDTALSQTVEGLIVDRLEQLDERSRNLVPWAAACGRSFSPEILRVVSGLAPAELVAAVEDLERRGIISASASSTAAYDFTHDLIRQAAYRQLSGPRRRIVHLQLARALETLSDPEAAMAGDIAHHAALGGDDELAARASIAAGERSLRMFAYSEAYALAARGRQRLDGLPTATRIRLHMALLRIAVHASVAVPDARNVEGEISHLTFEAQNAGLPAEAASGFHLLSFRHHQDGKYAAAHEDTLRAAEAGRQQDPAAVARTLGNTGRCLALIEREIPRAEALLNEAQGLAAAAGVEPVDIPWGLGLIRAFAGEYDEAVGLLESAVRLARRERDHWAACEGLQRLALIELERGNPGGARDRARDIMAVAAKMGEGSEAPFAAMLDALAARVLGEPNAEDRIDLSLGVLRGIDAKALLSRALTLAATIDLEHGHLERAAERAEEALRAADVVGRRSEIVMALVILSRVARTRGDQPAAERYAQAAAADLRDPHAVAAHARRAAMTIHDLDRR